MSPRLHIALASILVLALCGLFLPRPATAQYRQVLVQADPGGVMVAASIRFPVGHEADPAGQEGTAFLLARLLEWEGERRLREEFSRIQIDVGRGEFLVTLLAPPETWADAFRTVESLVQEYAPAESELALVRDAHLERLVFQAGAPVREFEIERRRMLLGSSAPGARPSVGNRASIPSVPAGGPAAFRNDHLMRSEAVVALVGPITDSEVAAVVQGPRTEVPSPRSFEEAPPLQPGRTDSLSRDPDSVQRPDAPLDIGPRPRLRLPSAEALPLVIPGGEAGPRAWTSRERSVVDRNLTSTWISVAWPFPAQSPRLLLDFLGRTLHEVVVSDPPEPGFYAAEVAVLEVESTPVLVFSATVDPRTASRWEGRIVTAMGAVADSPPAGAFFELGRRRFRNALFLDSSTPENRSAWLARQYATRGDTPDLHDQIWRISRDSLAGAAAAAGPPRILLFGPAAMMEEYGEWDTP